MKKSKLTTTLISYSLLLITILISCKKTEPIVDSPLENENKKEAHASPPFKLVRNFKKVNNNKLISAQPKVTLGGGIQVRVYLILQDHGHGNVWEVPTSASLRDDLDGDELTIIEIFQDVEEEFSIEIPDEDAEKIITVGDLIQYVEEHMEPEVVTPEPTIDWGPDGAFGYSNEEINTVDLENDLKTYRNKFVSAYIYTAGTTLKFKTYEKIVLVKPLPGALGSWFFDSIAHLNIHPEGELANMTVDLLVNYTNGTIYNDDYDRLANSYAKMEYSFKDKRTKVINGVSYTKFSPDKKGEKKWYFHHLGVLN